MIEADPIAAAVRAAMTTRTEWTGTASELLGALAEMAGERVAKAKTWPESPRALAGRLRRAATFLRKIGIDIGFRARRPGADANDPHHHNRQTRFTRNPKDASVRIVRTARRPAERQVWQRLRFTGRDRRTVRADPLKANIQIGADGADEVHPPQSVPENAGWSARL